MAKPYPVAKRSILKAGMKVVGVSLTQKKKAQDHFQLDPILSALLEPGGFFAAVQALCQNKTP